MITKAIINAYVEVNHVEPARAAYKAALGSATYAIAYTKAQAEFRRNNTARGHQDAYYSACMEHECHRAGCRATGINYKFEEYNNFLDGLHKLYPRYIRNAYENDNLLDSKVQRRWAAEN